MIALINVQWFRNQCTEVIATNVMRFRNQCTEVIAINTHRLGNHHTLMIPLILFIASRGSMGAQYSRFLHSRESLMPSREPSAHGFLFLTLAP